MNPHSLLFCAILASVYSCHASRLSAASQAEFATKDINVEAKNSPSDLRATFQIKVSMKIKPETATTYERTTINIETSPQLGADVVEIRDETRGVTSKYNGSNPNLESLFGPKTGLTDHVTVSAVVRLSRQPGEAIVRRTIYLRNVPPELLQKAEAQGTVRVNIQLDTAVKPEASLNEAAIAAQRKSVSDSQDRLLNALGDAGFKVIRRFEFVPGFILEVGPKALSILERMPEVLKVSEEHYAGIRIIQ